MVQGAFQDDVVLDAWLAQVEDQLAVIDAIEGEPAPGEGLEEQLLLGPDARTQDADPRVTRPSPPLPPARA